MCAKSVLPHVPDRRTPAFALNLLHNLGGLFATSVINDDDFEAVGLVIERDDTAEASSERSRPLVGGNDHGQPHA